MRSCRRLALTAWLSCALLSTWSAGAVSARISKEEVERWMGWTLAPLELRDMLSDGPSRGSTLAAEGRDDSAPSISGVVGSSLYISRSPALSAI